MVSIIRIQYSVVRIQNEEMDKKKDKELDPLVEPEDDNKIGRGMTGDTEHVHIPESVLAAIL